MSVHFDKEIAELKQRGISLNDLTGDEILALVHAVDRIHKPFRDANLEAVGMPVVLSDGTTLYNLTIGATVWLDEYAADWWNAKTKTYFWAMVYALAHGRDKDAFADMVEREAARKKIVKFALKVHVTEDELLGGIERAIHKTDAGEGRATQGVEQQTDWGEILRTLEVATGIPCEHWVWGRSADWCVMEYHKQTRFIEAMKGRSMPRMKDELDRAANNLARVRYGILKRLGKDGAQ